MGLNTSKGRGTAKTIRDDPTGAEPGSRNNQPGLRHTDGHQRISMTNLSLVMLQNTLEEQLQAELHDARIESAAQGAAGRSRSSCTS